MKKKKNKNKYRKPNPFTYKIFYWACKLVSKFKFNLKIKRNEVKGVKAPFLVIANHASSIDFINLCVAIKQRTHFVISNSFYETLSVQPLLKSVRVIPKNQFQSTVEDLKKMKAVIDNKMPLVIYPAGLMTENGIGTPIPASTGKALKWFGVDVYAAVSTGSYFTKPKWSKVSRKGKITLDVYKLADKETLASMSEAEVYKMVTNALSFDEYKTQETELVPFKKGDDVVGLDNVLFKCPHCKKEHTVYAVASNTLTCSNCGYSVKANNYGLFEENSSIPIYHKLASDWARENEAILEAEIKGDKAYGLSSQATIHKINHKKRKYYPVGEGTVTLDREKFTLKGVINGEDFYNEFPTSSYPTLPFSPGKFFEIQEGKDIFRIMLDDGKQVTKWIAALKIFYRMQKGE